MPRQRRNKWFPKSLNSRRARGAKTARSRGGVGRWRTLSVEPLEHRCMLAVFSNSAPFDPNLVLDGGLASGAAIVPPLPLEDTFLLHSKEDAPFVIFLDFDGHITQDTPWNGDPTDPDSTYIPTIVTTPYTIDGNGQFNDTELLNIQEIWARVSEDFAPFDVDVTTEDPGSQYIADNGMRVIIGGSTSNWYSPPNDPAGGVATGAFAGGQDWGVFAFSDDFSGNPKSTAEVCSHEVGHTLGLAHWGTISPTGTVTDYYAGSGTGPTGWAPIMGVGYGREMVQWSKGEYHLGTNVPIPDPPNQLQDDIATITNTVPFRTDDHGDDIDNATPLEYTSTTFFGEGIISGSEGSGSNDVDFFSFFLGREDVVFTFAPAAYGPNLDILATLYDEFGEVIATSNPIDDITATFSINTDPNDPMGINLEPGKYYISIDGTGKPVTTGEAYSDYGSMGYFSINAVRNQHLGTLVGVDFDVAAGLSPLNWTRYPGGSGPVVLNNLVDEEGNATEYDLTIASSKTAVTSSANVVDPASVPVHTQLIDNVDGFLGDTDVTWTFTWSDLEPLTVYEIYVFGMSSTNGGNIVQIVGHDDPMNVTDGPINFMQPLVANQLYVNGEVGDADRQLLDYTYTISSTETGTIEITVSSDVGMAAGVAGLGLREATLGSIQGIKWNDGGVGPDNDGAGNGVQDDGEAGLPGWLIYLDLNNNGQLDQLIVPDETTTQHSDDVPQVLVDGTSVKSSLIFEPAGNILDVDVGLNIEHSYVADLEVYLISPEGTRVKLFADVGSFGDNFTNTVFDDSAPTSITSGTAPFTGTFRPQEPLSGLNGENAQGEWKLEITDDASNDNGVLLSWYITVKYNPTPDVVSTVSSTDVPVPILDLQTVTSQLTVQHSGVISDVNVTLDITHTWDADLIAYLVSPTGTRVRLFAGIGPAQINFTDTTLDDEATLPIANGVAPYTGDFQPAQPLSAFDGEDSQGIWKLEITDTFGADQGTLNSWSITVRTQGVINFLEPYTTTDANGIYKFADLPPGVYYVREHFTDAQLEEGWRQVWQPPIPVTVKTGANVLGIDFGNWISLTQRGSIQGQKFNDLNGNGVKDGIEPGLAGWVIYVDANDNGVRDVPANPTTLASTDVPKPITDLSSISSQVEFIGVGTVFSVTVTLDITHSFVGDLEAFLISPSGTQVELFTEVGGQFNDFSNLTLDDNAARSIATLGAADLPYTGTWQPEGQLSDFIGEHVGGLWTLVIRDLDTADEGTLNSWSLNIRSGDIFTTTDANGNYLFDNLPAGQYIIREEQQAGWVQIPPQTANIPAAKWTNSRWEVMVVGTDDPSDPNGPDANRNVKNVNFGNRDQSQFFPGDYNRDGHVDAGDFTLWRRTVGTSVPNFSGADGDGDGVIGNGDYAVWRANFGQSSGSGAGSSLPASGGGESGAAPSSALVGSGGGAASASSGAAPAASASAASASSGNAKTFSAAPAAPAAKASSSGAKSAGGSATTAKVSSRTAPANSFGGTSTFYATTGGSIRQLQDRPFAQASVATSSRSDSALLSWLIESSQPSPFDLEADYGVGDDWPSSDAESVDAAFESVEELLLTGIAV